MTTVLATDFYEHSGISKRRNNFLGNILRNGSANMLARLRGPDNLLEIDDKKPNPN